MVNIRVSWIKSSKDKNSFKIFKNIGLDVFELDDLNNTDSKIKELVESNYTTIIISNELAGFSEDIIKKYTKYENVNIIISPARKD